jgi:hypothetical protein
VLAIVLPMPTSRPSTMTTRFPKIARLWAIRAPDTPPPTIATPQLIFLAIFYGRQSVCGL